MCTSTHVVLVRTKGMLQTLQVNELAGIEI